MQVKWVFPCFSLFLLSVVSCQQGVGVNPCLDPYYEEYCKKNASSTLISKGNLMPQPTAKPTVQATPRPTPLPTPQQTSKQPSQPANVTPPSAQPSAPQPVATPSPFESIPPKFQAPIARLSLGPSVFTFADVNEVLNLIWFAQDTDGNYVQDPSLFVWSTNRPDLFSVENGKVKALQKSGFAEITLQDPKSGLKQTMRVNMGRSSAGGTSNTNTPPKATPLITWETPADNTRFITGQDINFKVDVKNSDRTSVRFIDQNQNTVAAGNLNTTWQNAAPSGTYQITAQLLDAQQQVIAESQPRTFILDSTGLTAYYSNTRTDKIYTFNYKTGTPSFMSVGDATDIPGASPGFPSPGGSIDAIAKHPTNGRVYYDGGSGGNKLYYWDPAQGTNAASHVFVNNILSGGTSRNFSMLTFKSDTSELYGFGSTGGNRELLRIDTTTAIATSIQITPLGGASLPTSGDMAVDQTGVLFMSSGNRLYRVVFQTATEATLERLPNLLRQDDGTTVGSVSSVGFDALNRGFIMTTKDASARLYQFDPTQPAACIELKNFSLPGEILDGETSSAGDMTSAHGFL